MTALTYIIVTWAYTKQTLNIEHEKQTYTRSSNINNQGIQNLLSLRLNTNDLKVVKL